MGRYLKAVVISSLDSDLARSSLVSDPSLLPLLLSSAQCSLSISLVAGLVGACLACPWLSAQYRT